MSLSTSQPALSSPQNKTIGYRWTESIIWGKTAHLVSARLCKRIQDVVIDLAQIPVAIQKQRDERVEFVESPRLAKDRYEVVDPQSCGFKGSGKTCGTICETSNANFFLEMARMGPSQVDGRAKQQSYEGSTGTHWQIYDSIREFSLHSVQLTRTLSQSGRGAYSCSTLSPPPSTSH